MGPFAERVRQSTFLWGCVGTFFTLVLTVIGTMMHDTRSILWLAWLFAVGAIWEFARTYSTMKGTIRAITCAGTVISGLLLLAIYVWLAPLPAIIPPPEEAALKEATANLKPLMDALKASQNENISKTEQIVAIKNILSQYESLTSGITVLEKFNNATNNKDRLAALERTMNDMKIALSAVDVKTCFLGGESHQVLAINIAPNAFRLTFTVPMYKAPSITMPAPNGMKATVTEESNIGFTVVYTPLAQAVNHIFGVACR
jgi:hypothetical protein